VSFKEVANEAGRHAAEFLLRFPGPTKDRRTSDQELGAWLNLRRMPGAQSSPGVGFLSRLGVREVRICRDAVKERYPGIGSTPG
jgi:hypothetical protein